MNMIPRKSLLAELKVELKVISAIIMVLVYHGVQCGIRIRISE